MERLDTISDFRILMDRLAANRDPRVPTVVITAGTCGQASGANDLIRAAKRELLRRELAGEVRLRITGCHGYCEMEPSVVIEPAGTFYPKLNADGMVKIIDAVVRGNVVEDLLPLDPETGERVRTQAELPFYKKQTRTVLARNQKVDPIRINDYIAIGGYSSLVTVLEGGDPMATVREIKDSGLRGRGGAGFPTGLKWELLAKQPSDKGKFLVCNADEGDPGAYMDRSILEGSPHSVIEGMLVGAYATGATEGVVYVRAEYPLAIKHLTIALRQARERGLLGENILGTGFSFDIRVVKGAGAFVCGEETALIASIEGWMGEPRQRPPFPIQRGINGRPTAINNVETWANVPVIVAGGAAEFSKTGTKGNSGTKIFSLVGKITNTGLVEVPMGTSIEEVVYEAGGGADSRARIKAVQTGGPSGGCIPVGSFDLPIDYESLAEAGSIMGSGGMIVMDENTCMVDVAKYFMSFLKDESCGKCFTCRKGTQRMYEILDDITKGRATLDQLDLLEELALVVRDTTMCGLGQSAPNPILSTLRYFRHEYERHIVDKRCDAFVCSELVGAPCGSACPIGTEAWRYIAHIERGEYEDAYCAIRDANPFPSICARVCNHPCEDKCRAGTSGGEPIAIRALKRFVTDRIDPAVYEPRREAPIGSRVETVAVVGAGPAGLTAAHYLSLKGYRVTVIDSGAQPGGMLLGCIPPYRLPREQLRKEIAAMLDEGITFRGNTELGADVSIDELFDEGFQAVFVAVGAHKSRKLNVKGEGVPGVLRSMHFLKSYNLKGENLARGRVGVVGGGNSAVDAARIAIRQKGVESVTIIYRRTRSEMPAYSEEIEAALEEGIRIETLLSPARILSEEGHLIGVECVRNELGSRDASGRRRPVPVEGSEHVVPLDTLIVAISEEHDVDCLPPMGIELTDWGTIKCDHETLATSRRGVFAGGDVVTGPATVVDAIAAGKKAATMIERYLRGEDLARPAEVRLPDYYIEPAEIPDEELESTRRVRLPACRVEARLADPFAESALPLSVEDASREARRCLRCDLEFTERNEAEVACAEARGEAT